MSEKGTPLPWYVDSATLSNGNRCVTIFGDASKSHWAEPVVAHMHMPDGRADADAAFIVLACNAWNDSAALRARLAELDEP